jgi:U4/U6.U5 tri-snRNP-associated protein 1
MAEEERRKKNSDLKKARKEYTGYDDDEFVEGNAGMKRAVLAKYDDDLGTSETVDPFVPSGSSGLTIVPRASAWVGPCSRKRKPVDKHRSRPLLWSTRRFSLSITQVSTLLVSTYMNTHPIEENNEISDYLQEGDVGFKKPKVSLFSTYISLAEPFSDEEEASVSSSARSVSTR